MLTKHVQCISKKVYPLIFDNNFGKCGPIFKILLPTDSQQNSLCTKPQRFPPHLQYVATLPCEIRKSKNVAEFLAMKLSQKAFV